MVTLINVHDLWSLPCSLKQYLTAGQILQFTIVNTMIFTWYFVALENLRFV